MKRRNKGYEYTNFSDSLFGFKHNSLSYWKNLKVSIGEKKAWTFYGVPKRSSSNCNSV